MPGLPKHDPKLVGKVRLKSSLPLTPMAASELVPCFYTGQNCDIHRPAKVETRGRCRELKKSGVGRFERNGKVFVFSQRIETAVQSIFNGPMSAKNVLAFLKTRTDGSPLHYEIPHAGDRTPYARSRRRLITISSRVLFSQSGMQWQNYARLA
jgi:hypothetical protein